MNLVVRSYPVGVPGTEFVHQIPRGSVWLETRYSFDGSRWRPTMRWLVDNGTEPEEKVFRVVPEGEVFDFSPGAYRGICGGPDAYQHVFEVIHE